MFPEKIGEKRDSDFGADASGWKPGDEDPNAVIVHDESDPTRPGIVPEPELVDYHGILVSRERASILDDEERARREGIS